MPTTQAQINPMTVHDESTVQYLLANIPKSATLILENKNNNTGGKNAFWTYEGHVGILDDERIIKTEILFWTISMSWSWVRIAKEVLLFKKFEIGVSLYNGADE